MYTILVFVTPIALVVGSVAAATLLYWLLWQLFALVRHPELGPALVAILAVLVFTGFLPRSDFLDMTIFFALVAAIPLWFEGISWRREHRKPDAAALDASPTQ